MFNELINCEQELSGKVPGLFVVEGLPGPTTFTLKCETHNFHIKMQNFFHIDCD